jgi:hypothetical protein
MSVNTTIQSNKADTILKIDSVLTSAANAKFCHIGVLRLRPNTGVSPHRVLLYNFIVESTQYLGIIKNQIQNPAPPAQRAAQGFRFYV